MAKSTVNKVTTDTKTTEEPVVKGRVDFVVKDAKYRNDKNEIVSAVNEDGLLIAVPKPLRDEAGKVVYAGFDTRKYLPLKKGVFASIADYMRYQAFVARIRAAILIKGAVLKEKKADQIAKYGDNETRRKVAKVAKMREALKILEKQLKDEKVDITEID